MGKIKELDIDRQNQERGTTTLNADDKTGEWMSKEEYLKRLKKAFYTVTQRQSPKSSRKRAKE